MKRIIARSMIIAFLFVCIFTSCKSKSVIVTDRFYGDVGNLTIEDIWETEDSRELVNEMGYYLSEKCNFGDDITKLSTPERIIYVVYTLEGEVNNGGFSQYFFNSSGDYGAELVSAFTAIGAKENAEICKRAVSVFGSIYPVNRTMRQDIMLSDENAFFGDVWSECDNAFFDYPEDTAYMMFEFIMNNKDYFK